VDVRQSRHAPFHSWKFRSVPAQYDLRYSASALGEYTRCVHDRAEIVTAFKYAGEHKKYEQGNIRRRWNLGPFTLSPFICYDLRFPELPRECMPDANLLCYVACWPKARVHHWRQLLIARAIENQCYVVGVNRVGRDGAGLDYSGSSLVVDPLGAIVLDAGDQEGLYHAEIDANLATETRERFPFLRDL